MIILMMLWMHFETLSRFRKGRVISIQKFSRKQKINKYFAKQIQRLVNWCFDAVLDRRPKFYGRSRRFKTAMVAEV
jgi:hypothetical protein